MNDSRPFWIRDLEQMLDESVVNDAVAHLMEKLDEAVAALHPDSQALIKRYFDGATLEQLGRENSVSPAQVGQWIDRIKRELAQQLRAKCLVKN